MEAIMRKFTAVLLSTMFVLGSFTSVMAQDSDTKQTTEKNLKK